MGLFTFIGGLIGGGKQKKAATAAGKLQNDAALKGIAESARQYDTTRADFAPYQEAGRNALARFGDLLGLNGADTQQAQIDLLRQTPLYQSLYRNGENAVLANASATGGLRGGNTQHSLYNLGEDTLSALIERQLAGYRGLVDVGSGATTNVAGFGAQAVGEQNDLRNQGAAALAQAKLIRGGINAQNWQNAGGFLDSIVSSIAGGGIGGIAKALF